MKKKVPTFKTDAETERFVGTADLSKYDLSCLKALKMKNPPHPGFSVRVDCLEPHGLSVTERGEGSWCVAIGAESSGERECRPVLGYGYSPGEGVWQYAGGMDAVAVSV